MARKLHEAYEQVLQLRRRGFTYTEIANICNVSRGSVSNWLRPQSFSETITIENQRRAVVENKKRLILLNKARSTERRKQYAEAERLAAVEYQNYRTSPQFMAGLGVYLSVGDMTHPHLLRLTSSKPELHKIFIKLAISYLGVTQSSIHFWLLLHPDLVTADCARHWSKQTGLSADQFYKHQVIGKKSPTRTLRFGCGNTIIASTLLKRKLQIWLSLAKQELTSK